MESGWRREGSGTRAKYSEITSPYSEITSPFTNHLRKQIVIGAIFNVSEMPAMAGIARD